MEIISSQAHYLQALIGHVMLLSAEGEKLIHFSVNQINTDSFKIQLTNIQTGSIYFSFPSW